MVELRLTAKVASDCPAPSAELAVVISNASSAPVGPLIDSRAFAPSVTTRAVTPAFAALMRDAMPSRLLPFGMEMLTAAPTAVKPDTAPFVTASRPICSVSVPERKAVFRAMGVLVVDTCAEASCVTDTCAATSVAVAPDGRDTLIASSLDDVSVPASVPPAVSVFSAPSSPVTALFSLDTPEICAPIFSSRRANSAFLAANCASTSEVTSAPMSMPEPDPSVFAIDSMAIRHYSPRASNR